MTTQIPLVYITSNGYSGTTLLDLLLGAHPHLWTLGEAQNLPWELQNPRSPCGCGQPIEKDDFWQAVVDDIPVETEGYHIGYFRNARQVGKVLRWRLLPDLLRGNVSQGWRAAVSEYGKKNARYFRVVQGEAEDRTGQNIDWLVDNSKDPYRLFWLQQSRRFRVRAIHLIKDPRAFVYSVLKRRESYTLRHVIRYTARWIVENIIISRVLRSMFTKDVTRITYDELALRPKNTLQSIGEWVGIEYDPDLVSTFREYDNHAISGNMMRWRRSEDDIRLDESWKANLAPLASRLIMALTAPVASACGYPKLNKRK
ncbi:hypothetical protein GGP50_002651 [Salinibacter ruber]|uniref:sulfotransferase n=1 Tax=Salinibacter ruber TaxID=146919 RepID=UPI00216892B0|nr:sulfotransferase [Salinibacter ruber]MCS4194425.1 hypothetical protein [Salinibacter ruber]